MAVPSATLVSISTLLCYRNECSYLFIFFCIHLFCPNFCYSQTLGRSQLRGGICLPLARLQVLCVLVRSSTNLLHWLRSHRPASYPAPYSSSLRIPTIWFKGKPAVSLAPFEPLLRSVLRYSWRWNNLCLSWGCLCFILIVKEIFGTNLFCFMF